MKKTAKAGARAAPYHHGNLRAALIETTVALIRERGVAGVSLRDVAKQLGVTLGAPYHHFRDKDELLAAVAERGFARLLHASQQAVLGATRPQRLQAAGRAYVRFATANPAEYGAMFLPQFKERARFPALHTAGGQAFEILVALAQEVLALPLESAMVQAVALWSRWHGFACLVNDAVLTSKPGLPSLDALLEAVIILP